MKIQYASDLHLELSGNSRWVKNNPLNVTGDILVLAGDIAYLGTDCTNNPFWSWCADNYEQTLIVPGNHEYYGGFDLKDTLSEWTYELRSNVRYLNNVVVKLGHTYIVLSTLWSNVRAENALMIEQGQWIADSKITYWIYGHSHTNIRGKIGNTEFLSNQLGYVYEVPEAVDFNNGAYIKVQ